MRRAVVVAGVAVGLVAVTVIATGGSEDEMVTVQAPELPLAEGHPEPEVRPPDSDSFELVGMGPLWPLEFRLPTLMPGRYQLCTAFSFFTEPSPPAVNPTLEHEPFCKTIEVVPPGSRRR